MQKTPKQITIAFPIWIQFLPILILLGGLVLFINQYIAQQKYLDLLATATEQSLATPSPPSSISGLIGILTVINAFIIWTLITEKLDANKAGIRLTNIWVTAELEWKEVTAIEILNTHGSCIIYATDKALVYTAKRSMPKNAQLFEFLHHIAEQHQLSTERPSHIRVPSLQFTQMRFHAITGRGKLFP